MNENELADLLAAEGRTLDDVPVVDMSDWIPLPPAE